MIGIKLQAVFYILETIGIISFALSGMTLAMRKNFDLVGVYIIALVTAFGGGTFRDVVLDVQPVYWISKPEYPTMILIMSIIYYYSKRFKPREEWLTFPDTLGLALFTVTAAQVAVASELPPIIVSMMAAISATFGGLVRDILCQEVPIIFRKASFYSVVSFTGASLFQVLLYFEFTTILSLVVSAIFIMCFRLASIKFNWRFT